MVLYKLFVRIKYNVRFGKKVWIWYKDNKFEGANFIGNNSKFISSELGYGSYISNDSRIIRTKIGKYCSIGDGVKTHTGKHPSHTFVSTHPAFFSSSYDTLKYSDKIKFEEHDFTDTQKNFVVQIGNDVWIGCNVVITDGIKIGNGAIIAAGAVVTSDVPDFAIVGGVPAKIIKYRFSEHQIKFLKEFKWWEKSSQFIRENADLFEDIEKFMKKFNQ